MSDAPVAVVTGGNRGLGLEVGRQLVARGYRVVLTARDEARGQAAARGIGAEFLRLDVADAGSVAAFAGRLREACPGGVTALVANAAIAMQGFDAEVARATIATNFTGTLQVVEAVLPLLTRGAAVALVSSGVGDRGTLGPGLRAEVSADGLTRARLVDLMGRFVAAVREDRHTAEGWPSSAYGVSKIGVTATAHVLGRELAGDPRGIRVNAVCPGWVRTDMGGASAPRSVEQGAASLVWGATLGPDGPSGGFYRDDAPAAW